MGSLVQIISTEIIKPSTPTPHHLKEHKLSYLDQLVPPYYIPLIFFYRADESKSLTVLNHARISQQLKQSLSSTITSFYPLAGQMRDNSVVECNDAGCQFIEARACDARLMDAIKDPSIEVLKKFVPVDPTAGVRGGRTLLFVQITFFDCGGFVIVVSMLHHMAEFASQLAFINAWAGGCKGKSDNCQVSFDLANYFPARDFPCFGFDSRLSVSNKTYETKMLVFEKEKLETLKKVASSPSMKNPTRVEVVSAFIWKHFMESAKSKGAGTRMMTFATTQAVNMRPRTSPPHLLDNVFGNCVMTPTAFASDDDKEFPGLVRKIRVAIRTIDGEYIAKAQRGDTYLSDLSSFFGPLINGKLEWCGFSSWCRFPVYEVDFGWGNPTWFCTTGLPTKDTVILISSKCGDGIEAWVNMARDNINMLETQIKLL